MRVSIFSCVLLAIVLLYSCDKQSIDTTPPTMKVLEYMPSPMVNEICGSQEPNVFVLEGGEDLSFDVVFKDDEALSQYKIDIHNNFDCHGHGGGSAPSVSAPNVQNLTLDWTVLEIQDITGTTAPVMRTLEVPENVTAGNYHFHVQVIDESGNDSPFTNFFSLKITNPKDKVAPLISVDQPANSNLTISKGQSINFSGNVTDDRSLSDGGNGILYLAYTDLSSGNTFTTNEVFVFDEAVESIYDFDFDYTIPSTLVSGSYRFSLGANDGVRNVASFVFFDVEVID